MTKTILNLFIIFLLSNSFLLANTGNYGTGNARILGMSNVGTALNAGYYSSIKNPATLMSADDSTFAIVFSIPNFQVGTSTALTIDNLSDFMNYGSKTLLPNSIKDAIISDFDADGNKGNIFANANVNIFNMVIYLGDAGAINLAVNDYMSAKATIPKDVPDLLFYGNQAGRDYSFNELSVNAYWYRSAELGYTYNFIDKNTGMVRYLNAGVQAKYIMGNGYYNLSVEKSKISTSSEHRIDANILARAISSEPEGDDISSAISPNLGSGFGLSFGVLAELDMGLVLGLSVTDIGSINFTENVKEKLITKKIENFDDIKNIDNFTDDPNDSTLQTSEISMDLPTTLRFGLKIPVSQWAKFEQEELDVYIDFDLGLNDVGPNAQTFKMAIGIDYYAGGYWPRLMTGLSNDINSRFKWSGGIGYETSIFDIYISTYDIVSAIAPNNHLSGGLAMRWKI